MMWRYRTTEDFILRPFASSGVCIRLYFACLRCKPSKRRRDVVSLHDGACWSQRQAEQQCGREVVAALLHLLCTCVLSSVGAVSSSRSLAVQPTSLYESAECWVLSTGNAPVRVPVKVVSCCLQALAWYACTILHVCGSHRSK